MSASPVANTMGVGNLTAALGPEVAEGRERFDQIGHLLIPFYKRATVRA